MYRSLKQLFIILLIVSLAITFVMTQTASAQYWQSMPPYNVLWPLWTEALSPIDAITGLPTPLISSLTSITALPVSPVFVWDTHEIHPWFLYNAPPILGGGVYYFDALTGFNTFPPPDHLLPGGVIVPNTLPAGFEFLIPPFEHVDLLTLIANNAYISAFGANVGALSYFDLLAPGILWGAPPFPVF
ncbi:MAG: hypothetical protein ACMUIU_06645 [bacterium]